MIITSANLAYGLNIQLTFDDSNPYVDVNGVDRTYDIIPVMEAAAAIWEDIIEDAHTLSITYRWEDLTGMNNTNGPAANISYSSSGNRAVSGTVRFDSHVNPSGDPKRWFFDPTPFVNDEHSVGQTLYRELSAQQQSDWYSGAVPSVLESSFWGTALPTAPEDARLGNDLLTVALHELGHALGVSGSNNGLGDGDYDVQPSQMGNMVMAILPVPGDVAHLPNSRALVAGGIGDWRKMPSATDVLAAASTSVWTQIDLPRKDLLDVAGADDWNTPGNWIGNHVPDAHDDVYLRDGNGTQFGSLSNGAVAGNLTISDGSWLTTNNHQLAVEGVITIDGTDTNGFSGRLISQPGGVIVSDLLISSNGGELFVNSGSTLRTNNLIFPQPLDIGGDLEIGHVANTNSGVVIFGGASLNPSMFVDGTTTIGAQPGASALVRVETLGSAVTKTVVVGTQFSEGRIDVDGGSWFVDGSLIVGQDEEAAKGSVYLSNSGYLEVDGSATIRRGQAAQGILDIRSGATLDLQNFLNLPAGGTVTIQDDFSTLFANTIDVSGGQFNLLGGTVVADRFQNRGGSFVHNDGQLIVHGPFLPGSPGYSISGAAPGNNPQFELRNGGSASFTEIVRIGETGDAAVILVDPGTRLDAAHDIFDVGFFGAAHLEVYREAVVNHTGAFVMNLGVVAGSSGDVIVSGEGSRIDTAALMIVGDHGRGTLDINGGGRVSAARMWIAHHNDAQLSSASVSGADPNFNSSLLSVAGDLLVSGDDVQGNGAQATLSVSDSAAVDVGNLLKVWPGGKVQLDNAAIAAASVEIAGGMFSGSGAVVLNSGDFQNVGTVAPGLSPGVLTIADGNYVQDLDAVLAIELAGTTPSDADKLQVFAGRAELNGELQVSLLGGFMPRANDVFEIITAEDGVTGTFAVETLPMLTGALAWNVSYLEQSVALNVSTPFSADFDLDGDVDVDDRAVWEEHYGVDAGADADGDNDTDGRDFLAWQRQSGSGVPSHIASSAVPEPTSVAIGLVAMTCIVLGRRHQVTRAMTTESCDCTVHFALPSPRKG